MPKSSVHCRVQGDSLPILAYVNAMGQCNDSTCKDCNAGSQAVPSLAVDSEDRGALHKDTVFVM